MEISENSIESHENNMENNENEDNLLKYYELFDYNLFNNKLNMKKKKKIKIKKNKFIIRKLMKSFLKKKVTSKN